jgi:hypothetical protein
MRQHVARVVEMDDFPEAFEVPIVSVRLWEILMRVPVCVVAAFWFLILFGRVLAAPPQILVGPFDMFDTSADQRPAVVAAQGQWVEAAAQTFTQTLNASHRLQVQDSASAKAALAGIAADYDHPSSCRTCLLDAAEKTGATYLFIGSVHKVSDLIIYLGGELDEVATGKVLMSEMLEVKADNATMLRRAAAAMAAETLTHLPSQ